MTDKITDDLIVLIDLTAYVGRPAGGPSDWEYSLYATRAISDDEDCESGSDFPDSSRQTSFNKGGPAVREHPGPGQPN